MSTTNTPAHPSATKTKYRPVLTAVQISHLIALAKKDLMHKNYLDTELSISVLASLAPFEAKIQNAGIVPAYTAQPSHQEKLVESLGGTMLFPGNTSKEEYWGQCYQKYINDGAISCSVQELAGAKEHMYLNDLMTLEEASAFESNLGLNDH